MKESCGAVGLIFKPVARARDVVQRSILSFIRIKLFLGNVTWTRNVDFEVTEL